MKNVVDSSPELQYAIALHLHGFQSSVRNTNDIVSECHGTLRRYILDRDAGRWSSETIFEHDYRELWKYQQGYFVAYSKPEGLFSINRIPSLARGIEAKELEKRFGPPGTHIMDFTFDASQNILLVVTSSGIERYVDECLV